MILVMKYGEFVMLFMSANNVDLMTHIVCSVQHKSLINNNSLAAQNYFRVPEVAKLAMPIAVQLALIATSNVNLE